MTSYSDLTELKIVVETLTTNELVLKEFYMGGGQDQAEKKCMSCIRGMSVGKGNFEIGQNDNQCVITNDGIHCSKIAHLQSSCFVLVIKRKVLIAMNDCNEIDLENLALARKPEDIARSVQLCFLLVPLTSLIFILLLSTIYWCLQ